MILNYPKFIQNELLEALLFPREDILEETLKKEIIKICYPEELCTQVVFDAVEESYYTDVNHLPVYHPSKKVDLAKYQVERLPFYIPESADDETLIFESNFESGNLRRAVRMYFHLIFLTFKPII